ncbi:MAG: BLUF domain-containing protein [Acidobacteriota bacterium]|jgi:hypothetical protein
MLVRLLYASRATQEINDALVAGILKHSQKHNQEHGITGVLCTYSPTNVFLQVIEGSREEVNSLYNAIVGDPRHREITLLLYEEIFERRFAAWRMGSVNLNRINTGLILRFSERPVLDPFAMGGRACMALLDELVSTGAITIRD